MPGRGAAGGGYGEGRGTIRALILAAVLLLTGCHAAGVALLSTGLGVAAQSLGLGEELAALWRQRHPPPVPVAAVGDALNGERE